MSPQPSHDLIGLVLMAAESFWQAKKLLPARKAYELALSLDPQNLEALNTLGRIALTSRKPEEALKWFYRSLANRWEPATCVNAAAALGRLKRFEDALVLCDEALDRDCQPAWIHKAALLELMSEWAQAEDVVQQGLRLFPGDPELLFTLSQYQLGRGDFENGWKNYEHRTPRLDLAAKLDEYPEWQGEDLHGKTILVSGEQGLGDKIMFARYVPLLHELGADVVLFTSVELARLFATSLPDHARIRIVTSNRELDAVEQEIDYWVAMGSLPLRWSAFENSQPVGNLKFPYLFAPRQEIDRFAQLIPRDGTLRVGLCWRGNPEHRRDEYRSISWEQMQALTHGPEVKRAQYRGLAFEVPTFLPGCTFYSLQQGDTESGLPNLTRYAHDMADTAAAIANLDLVISVDTAVLHLAGALGVPAWGLIGSQGDWRWGKTDAVETPWYSSMRLIRSGSDWAPAIQFAVAALAAEAAVPQQSGDIMEVRTGTSRGDSVTTRRTRADSSSLNVNAEGLAHQDAASLIITRECRYGTMTWYRNDTYIGRALDLYGEYSQAEVELFKRILKPGDVVVEAGANTGALTVALAEIVEAGGGHVLAFEPQAHYFDLLCRNTATRSVCQYGQALGADRKELTIRHIPLDAVHAPGWRSTGEEFQVTQVMLDSMNLKRCNLIKVDVDGQELDILKGAEETIARCRPFLYVENDKPEQYPDLLPWMHAHGYRLYQHLAPLYNPQNFAQNHVNVFGSTVSAMVLAVPQERKDLHFPDLERLRLG